MCIPVINSAELFCWSQDVIYANFYWFCYYSLVNPAMCTVFIGGSSRESLRIFYMNLLNIMYDILCVFALW